MTLPGYEAQRALDMQWAFSTKKQDDYDTPLQNSSLTDAHPVREPNPAEHTKEKRSDKETYGKGHEWATQNWEVARDVRLARTTDGSSFILGWLFAFLLGKVTTSQPDQAGNPNTYYHSMKFFDPVTEGTAQLPVTSVVERVSAGIKRLLYSLSMSSLTITAEGFETISAAAELIGSGKAVDSTLTMPDLATVSYLASNYAEVKMGDASEDVTTRIRSWSVALANNPREARGYFPSSGLYRGRMEVGARTVVPSLIVDLDATDDIYQDFLDNTEIALDIYAEGELTEAGGDYYHYLRLRFPSMLYAAVPIEENDGVYTYAVNFDEESVLYDSGDSPNPVLTVEVQNITESYLTTET